MGRRLIATKGQTELDPLGALLRALSRNAQQFINRGKTRRSKSAAISLKAAGPREQRRVAAEMESADYERMVVRLQEKWVLPTRPQSILTDGRWVALQKNTACYPL
jgi:hypothetical protein